MAVYIHQFHRDLWERWHFNQDFWGEIQALCNGEREAPKPDWAVSLRMTHAIDGYDQTTSQAIFKSMYANPGDIDNFWIAALIREYKDQFTARDFNPLLTAPGALP